MTKRKVRGYLWVATGTSSLAHGYRLRGEVPAVEALCGMPLPEVRHLSERLCATCSAELDA